MSEGGRVYTENNRKRGVTLIELLIVVTIIGIIAGISFPAIATGLSGLRLSTAAGSVASFLTSTMNRVDRREEAAALVVSTKDNELQVFTAASGDKPSNTMKLPQGISIEGDASQGNEVRRYVFIPGGTVPRMTVVLRNDVGARRSIAIDPITAVPNIQRVGAGGSGAAK